MANGSQECHYVLLQMGVQQQVGRVEYYLKLQSSYDLTAAPLRLAFCTLFQPRARVGALYSAKASTVEAFPRAINVDAIITVLATAEPSMANKHDDRDHGKLFFMVYGNRSRKSELVEELYSWPLKAHQA